MGFMNSIIFLQVNGISTEKLNNVLQRYKQLMTRLSVVNETLSQTPMKNTHFNTVQGRTVRVNCTKQCNASKLMTSMKCNIFSNLRKIYDKTQTLSFEHVKVDELEGFACPVAGIKLKEVKVNGSINGISLEDLQKNVLKTSGDQIVTGNNLFCILFSNSVGVAFAILIHKCEAR